MFLRLAADEYILSYREVRAEINFLIYRRYTAFLRFFRCPRRNLLTVQANRTAIALIDTGQYLDQRRLASAILSHQGMDFPGPERKVNVLQCLDPRENLVNLPHFQ